MIAGVSITTLLLVLVAGIGAGFVGYAVGASSLISYPALLAFGIPPVLSNTTNTVGVCGTGIGGLLSARKELKGQGDAVWLSTLASAWSEASSAACCCWNCRRRSSNSPCRRSFCSARLSSR